MRSLRCSAAESGRVDAAASPLYMPSLFKRRERGSAALDDEEEDATMGRVTEVGELIQVVEKKRGLPVFMTSRRNALALLQKRYFPN